MEKRINLIVSNDIYDKIKEIARKEKRAVRRQTQIILEQALAEKIKEWGEKQ